MQKYRQNSKVKKIFFKIFFVVLAIIMSLAAAFLYARYSDTQKAKKITDNIAMVPSKYTNKLLPTSKKDKIKNQTAESLLRNQKKAIKLGYNNFPSGRVTIPSVGINLPIFRGVNQYTLSLGAGKDHYIDAKMGSGNYVLAGHNMVWPKHILFDDLKDVKNGALINLYDSSKVYVYKVYQNKAISPYVHYDSKGIPDKNNPYRLPNKGEPAKVTLYSCTNSGKFRDVVQGHLIKTIDK